MDTLREHLSRIGSIKSDRKRLAAQRNGELGGRPLGRKDSKPRKPKVKGIATIGRTIVQDSATS